jgi:hypothetical protein
MTRETSLHGPLSLAALVLATLIAGFTSLLVEQAAAQSGNCDRQFTEPITVVKLPQAPRAIARTKDGCWIFTGSILRQDAQNASGVAVLRRTGDTFEEVRFVPVRSPNPPAAPNFAFALALTNDQKVLVASHFQQVTFFDVDKLISGQGDPLLGQVSGNRIGYSFGVGITPDDKHVFVAQGATSLIAVIDLEKGRTSGFDSALAGVIPTAYRPSMAVLSRDGRYLLSATKQPPDVIAPTLTCLGGKQPEGAIQVMDVQRARTDPANATMGFASPAGCEPTTVAVSPDGARLSAVAAGDWWTLKTAVPAADNALVVFDARPLRDGKVPTLLGKVPVDCPTTLVDTGSRIVVGGCRAGSKVSVIDPEKVASGKGAILGTIPASMTVNEVAADGRTVFGLAMADNVTLQIIDLERVKLEPVQ